MLTGDIEEAFQHDNTINRVSRMATALSSCRGALAGFQAMASPLPVF
jgi:hypothetical protein